MQAQILEPSSHALKKILVLEADHVLSGVVLNLIANQDRFTTTSLRVDARINLLAEVCSRAPDVVIVDDAIFPEISANLFSLLQQFPTLKIVVLCTQENNLEVYSKQQSIISRTKDLIDVL